MSPSKRPDCTLSFLGVGNAFYLFQAFCILGVLELVLIAEPDIIHHISQTLDDVKGVDADLGVREVLPGDRDKAVAHVAAEVSHSLPLL